MAMLNLKLEDTDVQYLLCMAGTFGDRKTRIRAALDAALPKEGTWAWAVLRLLEDYPSGKPKVLEGYWPSGCQQIKRVDSEHYITRSDDNMHIAPYSARNEWSDWGRYDKILIANPPQVDRDSTNWRVIAEERRGGWVVKFQDVDSVTQDKPDGSWTRSRELPEVFSSHDEGRHAVQKFFQRRPSMGDCYKVAYDPEAILACW